MHQDTAAFISEVAHWFYGQKSSCGSYHSYRHYWLWRYGFIFKDTDNIIGVPVVWSFGGLIGLSRRDTLWSLLNEAPMRGGVGLVEIVSKASKFVSPILCYKAKVPLINLLIYAMPSSILTVKLLTIPNQLQMHESPNRICSRIFPMPFMTCLPPIQERGRFP